MSTRSPLLIEISEEIDGPRVRLRPYRPEDAPAVFEAVGESREHLAPWLPWVSSHATIEDTRAFTIRAAAHWKLRDDLTVGIFERGTGRFLGGAGLHRMNWNLRTFEIGYWIRASAQGRGYVRESVELLTRLAFNTLEANRVEIRMDARNVRSRTVAESLGYVLEGTLRSHSAGVDGIPRDIHIYALIPDDYRGLRWSRGEGNETL